MGDNIRNIRRAKHITRKYIAEHTGVSILRVALWEINLLKPSEELLPLIAAALGVSQRELTGNRQKQSSIADSFTPDTYETLPFVGTLEEGESLLWHGKPDKSRLFTSADTVNIPVSILFLAFSAYWTYMAFRANPWLSLFGVPFLLIGLYLLVFRFLYKRYVKERTYYVITDCRILFFYDGKNAKQVHTIPLSKLKDVRMTQVGTRGSLYFDVYGSVAVSRASSQRLDNAGLTRGIGEANAFFDVERPQIPYDILQKQIVATKNNK